MLSFGTAHFWTIPITNLSSLLLPLPTHRSKQQPVYFLLVVFFKKEHVLMINTLTDLIYINSWMLIGQKEIIQVFITLILYPPEIETPAESDGQRGANSCLSLGSLCLYN